MKLRWKAVCTLLCTMTLECIHITLNKRCNHQNNQTTVSFLKIIPKMLPVHGETDIPKDRCAERRVFLLKASTKRVNVCTYEDCVRVDVYAFINDVRTTFLSKYEFSLALKTNNRITRHEC